MATFLVTDPQSGRQMRLTGDTPPTEQELEQIFSSVRPVESPPEQSIGDRILGGLETAATVASGAIAEPIAGLAGIGAALNPFAEEGAGARRVGQVREALTLQPVTESGKQGVGAVGETLGAVVEPVQEFTQAGAQRAFEETGSPAVGAAFEILPAIASTVVGRFLSSPSKARVQTGNKISRELSQQSLERLGPNSAVKKAGRQGFDENIAVVAKNSSSPTKRKIADMVKVVERGIKDPLARQANRPSDIVGDSLVKRFEAVNAINKKASQQLDSVADTLKGKQVDFDPAVRNFTQSLADEGVVLGPDLKPSFVNSTFEGSEGAIKIVNSIMKRIRDTKTPDAFDGHRLKRFLDEQVSFGKTGQTGLTGRAENIVKGLRRDIDQTLDSSFPAYDKINTRFAETRTALDAIQDAAGRKIDFTGPNADKAGGVALRGLTNNTQKRANLLTALGELEDVAGRYGKQFGDDIATQVLMVNEFERLFPNIVGQTGLQGVTTRAAQAGAEAAISGGSVAAPIGVGALRSGINRISGINEENALKSIKNLLRGQR